MEIRHLDLCEARCPLALLLVKRTLVTLKSNQQLHIDAYDAGTKVDIPRFLRLQGYKIITLELKTKTRFVVTHSRTKNV